jgi:hypothetical protein
MNMAWLSVHLYRANGNNQKWIDKAKNALNDMESTVDFPIYTHDEGNVSVEIGSSADEMMDNWIDYIEENDIYVNEYDVHLLIVNTTRLGAGANRGGAVGPKGRKVVDNSEGTAAFANSAVRFANGCYGGEETFPPTIIHEVGHSVIHKDMDLPEENNEHSVGTVYKDPDESTSPMQLWYTADDCSGNDPPSDNCYSTTDKTSQGATNSLTVCCTEKMNDYMNSW